ncbi:hypothetical protein AB0J43_05355 [Nonomuraea fuscirosea]
MISDERPWLVDMPPGPVVPLWRLWLRNGAQFDGDGRWMVECGKPDCGRAVPEGVRFCCAPCAVAAEGRFEVDAHLVSCDALWAEREQALKERFPA